MSAPGYRSLPRTRELMLDQEREANPNDGDPLADERGTPSDEDEVMARIERERRERERREREAGRAPKGEEHRP